jgi:hypothetical protein
MIEVRKGIEYWIVADELYADGGGNDGDVPTYQARHQDTLISINIAPTGSEIRNP